MTLLTPWRVRKRHLFMALSVLLVSGVCLAAAGTIEVVVGTARVFQHHGQERPAIRGDQLYEGETVVTGSQANVKLRMLDEAAVWIRPDTRFRIEKYRSSKHGSANDEARLHLVSGSIRQLTGSIGKVSTADYRLTTPNATIGIRGTEFDAVFVTAQAATALNTPAGTYNRVYSGTTSLSGGGGPVIILNTGQAGFIGLTPNAQPQTLPTIPPFLNTTTTSGAPPPTARNLQVSVRLGEPASGNVISTQRPGGAGNSEQQVRVLEGARASMALVQGTSSQTVMEVVATVSGNTATVQFAAQAQSAGRSGQESQGTRTATTLRVTLGEWTEVSGQGPWSSSGSSVISTGRLNQPPRVYLRVDEVGR